MLLEVMLLQVCAIVVVVLAVSSEEATMGRQSRFRRQEVMQNVDGSGVGSPLFLYEAPTDLPQNTQAQPVNSNADAAPLQDPLLVNITFEGTQDEAFQEGSQPSTELLNVVPATSTEFLIINISIPAQPNDLISRLVQVTSKVSYSEKLDIAMRLNSLTHELMSSIDDNFASLSLS